MRYAVRIQGSKLFLAALYRENPIFTPYQGDACDYRYEGQALEAVRFLTALGYTATLEEVTW